MVTRAKKNDHSPRTRIAQKRPLPNKFLPRGVDRLPALGRAIPDDGMPPALVLER